MVTRKRRRQRGRPPFKATPVRRRTVERMCACGDSHYTIARALEIDDDTLRKHFPEELAGGAAKRRREVVEMVFKGASAGNATLIKRLEEMTRVSSAEVDPLEPREIPAARAPKLGKKEVQRQDAMAAGESSDWGDDLKPPPDRPLN